VIAPEEFEEFEELEELEVLIELTGLGVGFPERVKLFVSGISSTKGSAPHALSNIVVDNNVVNFSDMEPTLLI